MLCFFRDQAIALRKGGNQVGLICALPVSFKTVMKEKEIKFYKEQYSDEGVDTVVKPFLAIPKHQIEQRKGLALQSNYL